MASDRGTIREGSKKAGELDAENFGGPNGEVIGCASSNHNFRKHIKRWHESSGAGNHRRNRSSHVSCQ
jgi:hypothetical protein